jgi:hypothetical protein
MGSKEMLLLFYDIFIHSLRPNIVNTATCHWLVKGKTCDDGQQLCSCLKVDLLTLSTTIAFIFVVFRPCPDHYGRQ